MGNDFLSKHAPRPSLLVSVRSPDEVALVRSRQIDWIDLKDPDQGPLGRPDLDALYAFRNNLVFDQVLGLCSETISGFSELADCTSNSRRRRWSVAGGELKDWDIDADQPYLEALGDFGAIKWALSDCDSDPSWQLTANELASRLRRRDQAILVHYADHEAVQAPNWFATLQATRQLNLKYLLIDTAIKDGRTLIDYYSPQALTTMIADASKCGIDVAIAGSIRLESIPSLIDVGAAWIGVRGAVCSQNSRSSPISPEKLDRAVAFIQASGTTTVSNR